MGPAICEELQIPRFVRRVPGDQVRVRRDAGDPGSAGCELVVQHQLVRREAQTLSATERGHDGDKLFINYFDVDFDLSSLRDGRVWKRDRRGRSGRRNGSRVDFIAHFAEHFFAGQWALGRGRGDD